jgi:acetyl-CoA carboxylase biotin carboxylase subunit
MKLLIANRGEIAVRIVRACREMGIRTVAVYSEADRLSPHVLRADEAYPIGPAPATESYLVGSKMIDVARRSGATLVHPGYGFLAENAEFAQQVLDAGLVWVGPSPEAIALMGSKTESRKLARSVGAPLIPGLMEPITEPEQLEQFVEAHGLPVLLKAVAGGGGKGMRQVTSPNELTRALERAQSEGAAYFGDSRVYVERLVVKPRHVEIQVAADRFGNAVYVGERECSIQRRHQKVVEECPSPAVDPELRQRMGEAAVAITKAAEYETVGTVEFLLDEDESFYFLEMNTRLQVEHPVTEEVYGLDLVHEQIRLALGERLSWRQDELVPRGHAIECRIYAEDPLRGFAPSPGTISLLRRPSGPGVRIDSGVTEGSVVPLEYDPMLAKVIAWAPDRSLAVERLGRVLEEYMVGGIATTLPLFRALIDLEAFRTGELHTGLLDEILSSEQLERLHGAQDPEAEEAAVIAAACLATLQAQRGPSDPFAYARDRSWWEEGLRMAHGRYPR